MNLHLPTFVFLFEPEPDPEFHAALAARSMHMVFNITDPLQDVAAILGLPWTDMEDQLRLRWPALLGTAIMTQFDHEDPPPVILTHCRFIEDLNPFLLQFGTSECLAVNCGPIWKLPPRCRTITIPVEGTEERLRFLQHELTAYERPTVETAIVQTTAQSAGPQDG